ncbi:glycoside hydrolase family 88/105 protein [Roseimarinus sediminis]|uniref:glycoside hydrolase family 88/105 protein n=1 Tax=Roseimarinus sediminis TaxID=1610899 RepID=UPI003D1D131B
MKKLHYLLLPGILLMAGCQPANNKSEEQKISDTNTPLHAMQVDYPSPYGAPAEADVKAVLDRVLLYLDEVTPKKVVDSETGEVLSNFELLDSQHRFEQGDFRLTSYEWGVTYAGMLLAAETTGDERYSQYTLERLQLISDLAKHSRLKGSPEKSLIHSVLHPGALDDAGAICAAMIKALEYGATSELRPSIDNFIAYIHSQQYRLSDGTLARNRPQPNTLWLDDLFMSVPALAQMGKLSGDQRYFDDAVKQVLQFSERMFNHDKGLYMHGWVEHMSVHPQFHWARANGWAVMAMVELLDVLPRDHEGFPAVLLQLQQHVAGLVKYQDGAGFWHQLLDHNNTYLETSATAIFSYSMAKAINEGWIDASAYAPAAILGWNAVTTKVNAKGQVEGTCVGTGMAFDPAFYYYRPVNVYAAHGYGPVLLAGAEIIRLMKAHDFEINDSSLQLLVK